MVKHIATAWLLLLMYVTNYLGSATNLLGIGMNDLASTFPLDFMPPGVIFSITWTAIFITQGIFFVHMWIRHRKSPSIHDQKELLYFWLITFLNITWILLTANTIYGWAIFVIFLLLGVLFLMLMLIKKKKQNMKKHTLWLIFDEIVWGLYYGWITMASVVLSISQAMILLGYEWVFTATWAIIILSIGAIFALISKLLTRNCTAFVRSGAVLIIMILTITQGW